MTSESAATAVERTIKLFPGLKLQKGLPHRKAFFVRTRHCACAKPKWLVSTVSFGACAIHCIVCFRVFVQPHTEVAISTHSRPESQLWQYPHLQRKIKQHKTNKVQ